MSIKSYKPNDQSDQTYLMIPTETIEKFTEIVFFTVRVNSFIAHQI